MKRWYDIDSLDNLDVPFIERLYRLSHRFIERYFRYEAHNLECIPPGPALFVGNHSGGLVISDSFLFGSALIRAFGASSVPYGLGHEWAIRSPGDTRSGFSEEPGGARGPDLMARTRRSTSSRRSPGRLMGTHSSPGSSVRSSLGMVTSW